MVSLPIRWILARTYSQATEDEARVGEALDSVVSGGEASTDRLEGQAGNPVRVFSRRLERADELRSTWARWAAAGLPRDLLRDLDGRLDDNAVLHFRLDKQEAARGALVLRGAADVIDIQVKLKAYPAKPEEIHRVAHALLSEAP